MTNVELLERTMQHIKDHPETHRQDLYITPCGTAACFAGWAVKLSDRSAGYYSIGDLACKLLGLTYAEAARLFAGSNSRPMLELMVKDLVNGNDLRYMSDYREEAEAS